MKKKLSFVLVIVFALTLSLCLTACNPGGGGGNNVDPFSVVSIKPLADLTDYSKNATVDAVTYEETVRAAQVAKLEEKQAETKEDLDDADEDYSTYTKIFKRSDANEIVRRMSLAGLPQDKMVALVEYISREDVDNGEKTVKDKITEGLYVFTVGEASLIRDYEDVDELQEYYDEHDDDTAAYDALARKKRKVSQESIVIFKTDADQYARTMLEELLYVNDVVDQRVVLKYGEGGDPVEKYKDYFRDVYFDYETLSYMLAFNETVGLTRDAYTASKRTDFVRLYAYHYQYQKGDTEALNDKDYLEYLRLSHLTTMSDTEAENYRQLDSRSYQKAYRYNESFYTNYQRLHLAFQLKQETYDKEIYVGGSPTTDAKGNTKPKYETGIGSVTSNDRLTYSSEMSAAMQHIGSVLKITDTEHEYFKTETNTRSMNRANTAWNKLTDKEQAQPVNKIYKVNLELQNLKLQKYSLDYKPYLKDTDFVAALQYQVKSYSADYIRTIQSYKKKDVTLNKELDRLYDKDEIDEEAIAAKIEEIGRNMAMLVCLEENYSGANIENQMTLAKNVEWTNIRDEIQDALTKDYVTYHQNNQGQGKIYVDEYFEDNLVKKKYSCGGTKENCLKGESHMYCTKEYDDQCRISRTINNHENVFRHAYGQVVITYAKNDDLAAYRIDEVSASYNPSLGSNNGSGTYSKDAKVKPKVGSYSIKDNDGMKTETIDSDKVPTLATFVNGKWTGNFPSAGNITLSNAEVDGNATVTYTAKEGDIIYEYHLEFDGWFVDKQLQWRAQEDETFSYDVRLYPGYRITKTVKKN